MHTSGEELLLRKFFKFSVSCSLHSLCHVIVVIKCLVDFQVAKPLDVKTKFMNVEVLLLYMHILVSVT